MSALPRAPGRAPPGTRGARRAAGPGSPCRPRRAGSGSGRWLGLVAAMGEGRGPREAPPARAWRLLRPAFLESQRVQVGPSSWFSRMTAPKIDVDQVVGPTTVKTVGEAQL